MKPLPPPLETVVVPETFSPSQLVLAAVCPLRCVLTAAGKAVPRLPAHPAAERGVVFHSLLEHSARGCVPRLGTARASVENELSRLLEAAAERLAAQEETRYFARLEETLPEVEWHNITRDVLTSAERLLGTAPPFDPGTRRSRPRAPLRYEELPPEGSSPEVRIFAPALRLSGRMDLVEKLPGYRVHVRDYKTGRVRDREGAVLETIALQLRLYGVAIGAVDPLATVELSAVEGASDVPIDSGSIAMGETLTWLRTTLDTLPAGAAISTREIARPGPGCTHCTFRHACPAYLEFAPPAWAEGTSEGAMPFDIWGTIVGYDQSRSGVGLTLADAAGRRVSVQRLSPRHGPAEGFARGKTVYLFGLAVGRPSIVRGIYHHARNFYEIPVLC